MSCTLWWVLTRVCNLACAYCYQGSDHGAAWAKARGLTPAMPGEVLEKTLPWALRWLDGELRVNLYGGEPSLAWDVIEEHVPRWKTAFAATPGRSVQFGITTNGTRLGNKTLGPPARAFLDREKIGVLLSLDGPKHLHEKTRVHADGRGSWDEIDPPTLLAWRPKLEIAWQLDPKQEIEPGDLDELIDLGFKNINFNLNWLVEWSEERQLRLQRFFKHLGRRLARGEVESNWREKYVTAGTIDQRMPAPCGTGLRMLGLTPEGWLYPSQEMAFTVFEPGRAEGTAEYYRVGDVSKTPVIDVEALARVSTIQLAQIKPPPPFDCNDCVASSASIGGCHCRYVGQRNDASYRYDTPAGYCQSMRAAMTGLIQGFWIERQARPKEFYERQQQSRQRIPLESVRPRVTLPDVVKIEIGR